VTRPNSTMARAIVRRSFMDTVSSKSNAAKTQAELGNQPVMVSVIPLNFSVPPRSATA
jgi:hypothetical protein